MVVDINGRSRMNKQFMILAEKCTFFSDQREGKKRKF